MKTRNFLPASLAAVMALVTSAAFAQVTDTTAKVTPPVASPTSPAPQVAVATPPTASDSTIVASLIAANQKEIAEAEVAIAQAQSDHVKEFARRIQRDHSKAVEDLQSYLQKSGGGMSSGMGNDSAKMNPPIQGNDTRSQPDSTYANQQTKTQPVTAAPQDHAAPGEPSYAGKTGKDFDKAWVESIEDQHKQAIDDLRDNVIPRIQDSDLKKLVQGLLPVMGNHLREAEQLEAELK